MHEILVRLEDVRQVVVALCGHQTRAQADLLELPARRQRPEHTRLDEVTREHPVVGMVLVPILPVALVHVAVDRRVLEIHLVAEVDHGKVVVGAHHQVHEHAWQQLANVVLDYEGPVVSCIHYVDALDLAVRLFSDNGEIIYLHAVLLQEVREANSI